MNEKPKNRAAWWWIDRWRKSTAYTDMTVEERGAYRELLDELWLRGGTIPNDDRILARIVGDPDAWKRVKKVVLARFIETPEGLTNETHDEVSSGSNRFSESQSEKGKKGAAKRWGNRESNGPANSPAINRANVPAMGGLVGPANGLPSPSPSPTNNLPAPPAREEPDAVDAESAELSRKLIEALKQATEVTGLSGAEILADAKVRGKAAPITNPGACTAASRKLWGIAIERVGGFVAAWKADQRAKPAKKRGGAPAWDRGLESQITAADLEWDPRLGPKPEPKAPVLKKPELILSVAPGACLTCGSPLRHSTEGGESVLRCSADIGECDWAAVWQTFTRTA